MRPLIFAAAALLLGTSCFEECDKTPPWDAPEDIAFGRALPKVEARKEEAPQPAVAEAPPPAPAAPFEVPKFTVSTDAAVIAQGKEMFATKGCVGCHKIGGGKLVGPDLKGVTARRDQEWLVKMILRPEVMVKEDETAKKLFVEHLVPMPNQNVDPLKELPQLLAFLKSNE